jgi:uncharacterized protein (TIRG00374 family)
MNTASPKRSILRVLRLKNIFALAVLGMVAYILANTDFRLIWFHIRAVPLPLMMLLLCLQLITQFSLNLQWYRLCGTLNLKTSFFKLLVINSYGMIADAVTPGEKVGGELVRVVQLKRLLNYSTNQSTSLVAIQKSISLFALILLNIAAVMSLYGEFDFLKSTAVRIAFIAVLISLALFLLSLIFFSERLNVFVQRLPYNGKIAGWIKNWMQEFAEDTKEISRSPGRWIFQLLLSFGIWALFPMKLFILISEYTEVNLLVLFAITFVSYFAAMIPLLPGGLGTFEGTMSGMLLVYGLSAEEAVAVSLIFRFVTFWFVVLFSALIILLWKLISIRRKSIYEGQ